MFPYKLNNLLKKSLTQSLLVLSLTAFSGSDSDDGGVTGKDSVSFIVNSVNEAPILSQIEGKATYQNTAIEIALTAIDSNGDTLTYDTSHSLLKLRLMAITFALRLTL